MRARVLTVHGAFFTNGFIFASWVSRLPAVRTRLGASEPELGTALLAVAVGAVVAMPLTSRLCDRFGLRRVLATAVVTCTAMFAVASATPHIVALAGVLLLVGVTYGTWDVAMNTAAHGVELALARPLMPRFHAAFSVGGLCGAGLGALAAGADLPAWLHLTIAGAVVIAAASIAARHVPTEAPAVDGEDAEHREPRAVTPRLVLLGLLTACATLGEGAAADWGAIFLTDERHASESVAAIGYAGFAAAMAVGRFSGTWVLGRFSRVRILQASGVLASASVLALVTVDSVAAGLVAMLGWGLGVAIVFPAAMSAGAENARRPAQGIATVATIGYFGFIVGPPAVGFLAGAAGLGIGLLVASSSLLLVVVLARAARPAGTAATAAAEVAVLVPGVPKP